MYRNAQPIDVITLCGADGALRPLRIRAEEGAGERIRGNIQEILCEKSCNRVGAEERSFLCRVQMEERNVVLELLFHVRSHSWYIVRRLY